MNIHEAFTLGPLSVLGLGPFFRPQAQSPLAHLPGGPAEEGRRELVPTYFNHPGRSRQGFPVEKEQRFAQGPLEHEGPRTFPGSW